MSVGTEQEIWRLFVAEKELQRFWVSIIYIITKYRKTNCLLIKLKIFHFKSGQTAKYKEQGISLTTEELQQMHIVSDENNWFWWKDIETTITNNCELTSNHLIKWLWNRRKIHVICVCFNCQYTRSREQQYLFYARFSSRILQNNYKYENKKNMWNW